MSVRHLRLVRLGAGIGNIDLPGCSGRLEALRVDPLRQCRPGMRQVFVRAQVGNSGHRPAGKLAGLDAGRAGHRRPNGHPALELDGATLHRVVDRERHSGRLLPAPLDVAVNLPEQLPHDRGELVDRCCRSDSHVGLRSELGRPEFAIHMLLTLLTDLVQPPRRTYRRVLISFIAFHSSEAGCVPGMASRTWSDESGLKSSRSLSARAPCNLAAAHFA